MAISLSSLLLEGSLKQLVEPVQVIIQLWVWPKQLWILGTNKLHLTT